MKCPYRNIIYNSSESKNIINCSAGTMKSNMNYNICIDCMREFEIYLRSKQRGEKDE